MNPNPNRYRIAPWKGRYGDQAHQLRLHAQEARIKQALEDKKAQLERVYQQVRQLEYLEQRSHGTVLEGVLVHESTRDPQRYKLRLATNFDGRWGEVYPNAHNDGKTFGYEIAWTVHPHSDWENRGSGHTLEQAILGVKSWVLRSERLARRFCRNNGSIWEETEPGRDNAHTGKVTGRWDEP